jgi:hypothetical protein
MIVQLREVPVLELKIPQIKIAGCTETNACKPAARLYARRSAQRKIFFSERGEKFFGRWPLSARREIRRKKF